MIQLALSILLFTFGAAEPADSGAPDPGCDPQEYREVVVEIARTDQLHRSRK